VISAFEGPRLLAVPTELRDPDLVDGTEWAGVDVSGEVGGEAEVDSLDVAASRLANLRLTGRRIDGLHMTDVLVEDCELSGVVLPAASLRRHRRRSGLHAGAAGVRLQHRTERTSVVVRAPAEYENADQGQESMPPHEMCSSRARR
jgi:hypothetical protein